MILLPGNGGFDFSSFLIKQNVSFGVTYNWLIRKTVSVVLQGQHPSALWVSRVVKCGKYHTSAYLTGMLWGSIGSKVVKFHSLKITLVIRVVSIRIELPAFVSLWDAMSKVLDTMIHSYSWSDSLRMVLCVARKTNTEAVNFQCAGTSLSF